jgi:EspG family
VPRFRVELSPVELDVVWRSEPFEELPLIIDVPSPGATHAERAALEARVWAELVERELADDHGRAAAEVVDLLEVIARRRRSLQLRTFGPDPVRAILAVRGPRAVLGVLDEKRLRLANVPDTGLADTLLSLLPEVPAGRGHSVSVSAAALTEATGARTASAAWDVLTRHGLNRDDARILLDMATGSVRTGQIAADRRKEGRLIRTDRVVAFHDTQSGRYQTVRKVIESADYLTIGPASRVTLARSTEQLLRDLR